MRTIVFVNPFRCRMWDLHDRDDSDVNEETCKEEIQSISKNGQLVPVLGRPLEGDAEYDVELIYGSRRLFVTRHLNIPLFVELRKLDNPEGIVAMDVENRLRRDISSYERGHCYLRWLREKHFKSQEEIARTLKISPAKVSRLIRIAQLPSVIVNAFEKPSDIRENWGQALASTWSDADKQAAIAKRARAMASKRERPSPENIFKVLVAPIGSVRVRSQVHDEVVKDERGRPLFRVRRQRYSVSIVLPIAAVTDQAMQVVLRAVKDIFRDETLQPHDPSNKSNRASVDQRLLSHRPPESPRGI